MRGRTLAWLILLLAAVPAAASAGQAPAGPALSAHAVGWEPPARPPEPEPAVPEWSTAPDRELRAVLEAAPCDLERGSALERHAAGARLRALARPVLPPPRQSQLLLRLLRAPPA